jgi:hypothetical protein
MGRMLMTGSGPRPAQLAWLHRAVTRFLVVVPSSTLIRQQRNHRFCWGSCAHLGGWISTRQSALVAENQDLQDEGGRRSDDDEENVAAPVRLHGGEDGRDLLGSPKRKTKGELGRGKKTAHLTAEMARRKGSMRRHPFLGFVGTSVTSAGRGRDQSPSAPGWSESWGSRVVWREG